VEEEAEVDEPVALSIGLNNLPAEGASVQLSIVSGKGRLSHSGFNVSAERSTQLCDIASRSATCGVTLTPEEADPITVRARWGELTTEVVVQVRAPEPELRAEKVLSARTVASGLQPGEEYDSGSITVRIDPGTTAWVAWNNAAEPSLQRAERPGEALLGPGGFGTDDYIEVTVTNPDGEKLTVVLDRNDALGRSSGPQNVIFGAAGAAPGVVRISPPFANPPNQVTIFDEGGTHNEIFDRTGNYTFDFRFVNAYTNSGAHQDIYLLIAAK
jgi:hypothetical protein